MPVLALLAVFILVPLVELYVIIEVVGEAIGAVWTILLLAADSVLGTVLLRSQGRAVWTRFNATLAAGKMPHTEVVDGVLVIFGAAFLITPGFITDAVGLLLLIPPSRSLLRRGIMRWLAKRVTLGMAVGSAWRSRRQQDVEGTAEEYEEPPSRLNR